MQGIAWFRDWPIARDSSPRRGVSAQPSVAGSVIALGNFDGLHPGHQTVLQRACALATEHATSVGVMSFHPHPRSYFVPDLPPQNIMSVAEKTLACAALGMDYTIFARFNAALAELSAEDFITRVLVGALGISHLVTGEDFVFGAKRQGNAETLRNAAKSGAFSYHAVAPVCGAEGRYASSLVRAHVREGRMENAAQALGRPYSVMGRVVHGDARGREWGFPTANIPLFSRFLPQFGVYAVRVYRPVWNGLVQNGAETNSKTNTKTNTSASAPSRVVPSLAWLCNGVANLGVRPTIRGAAASSQSPLTAAPQPLLEVHGVDWQGQLYGQRLVVQLVHFLRPEQRFPDVAALRAQIAHDAAAATRYFTLHPSAPVMPLCG